MPPVGKERPDDQTYDAVISSLEASLDRAAAGNPNPGRTATIRRLTRTEYQNAIRDLLALDVDVASLLPGDESSYGFDNVTVGDLSPTLLDRYVSAAEKISRMAVGRASRSPGGETIRVLDCYPDRRSRRAIGSSPAVSVFSRRSRAIAMRRFRVRRLRARREPSLTGTDAGQVYVHRGGDG